MHLPARGVAILRGRRFGALAAAAAGVLIILYGALLRADVLAARYGPWSSPPWLAALGYAPTLANPVRPPGFTWYHVDEPYVGGDPVNYLRYAREMRSFYQGHLREPVFLAVTRGWLALTGGADISVSLASMTASILAIGVTMLLGASVASRAAGLLAGLALAIDYDAVSWAPDGWRDDTFTCAVVLSAWALVRLRRKPTLARAGVAGTVAALACLTRITALSFVVPAALWVALDGEPGERRSRTVMSLAALAVAAVLVSPYLINSWRVTGDPFIALDAHTTYYRAAEGKPFEAPQTAAAYVWRKIVERPVQALDTSISGLLVHPVENKAQGFAFFAPWLGTAVRAAMLVGLFLFLFMPDGRLLIVIAVTSLAPYALTWNVGGGGEWRFTMHVYPILLVAAAHFIVSAIGLIRPAGMQSLRQGLTPRAAVVTAIVVLLAAGGTALVRVLPYYVVRESIANGESTSIEAGPRDAGFFHDGWLPPRTDGNVTSRTSTRARARIRLPLPSGGRYALVLRMDPIVGGRPSSVTVLLNRHVLGRLTLELDPARVGSYRLHVPGWMMRRGANELALVADGTVPAAQAGDRYRWLPGATPLAFRLWYVRVLPEPAA